MNKYAILSPRFPGARAHSSDMFTLLGFEGQSKWPDDGVPIHRVQGIKVWVEPRQLHFRADYAGRPVQVKSSSHRVKAECPGCGAVVSAGRLFQHKCKVKA